MKSRLVFGTIVFVSAASGCITITDPSHTHPGCTAAYNSEWQTYIRFEINHTDPRTCPVGLQYGQQGTSGGIVYDLTAPPYPTAPNSQWLDLGVYDYSFGVGQCSNAYVFATEFFSWGQPRPGSTALYEWRAQRYVSFTRLESPDYTCFEVRLNSPFIHPKSVITINYYGDQA